MRLTECPWCGTCIEIVEIKCGIFRCGVWKSNGEQIPPHSSKSFCDEAKEKDLIYGCGKPFRYNDERVEKCDYI